MIKYVFILARVAEGFICELDTRFPAHAIMDALRIVYPQY
jgi:hypothetical protein